MPLARAYLLDRSVHIVTPSGEEKEAPATVLPAVDPHLRREPLRPVAVLVRPTPAGDQRVDIVAGTPFDEHEHRVVEQGLQLSLVRVDRPSEQNGLPVGPVPEAPERLDQRVRALVIQIRS